MFVHEHKMLKSHVASTYMIVTGRLKWPGKLDKPNRRNADTLYTSYWDLNMEIAEAFEHHSNS